MINYNLHSIQALTGGLKDGGCKYTTNFSGFNSHLIFKELGGKQMSLNERVAYEMAYGASLAGRRSVVTFKGVGLNVAADPFLHSVLNGINAGIVLVLTEDIEAESSPESQDSRAYRDIFGGLWLEPADCQEAYDFGYDAFEWSEKLDMPIVIRLTNQFFVKDGKYEVKAAKNKIISVEKRRSKYISFWKSRNDNLINKLSEIDIFVKNIHSSREQPKKPKGIIVFGNCDRELRKLDLSSFEILRLSTYPFSKEIIEKFSQGKTEIIVFEQGGDYAFRQIKNLINPSCRLISDTGDRPDRSDDWIIWNNLEKLFLALKENNPSFVVGDEGTFTDESTKLITNCLSMGSSIAITAGMAENNIRYPFCIIGDTAFTFSGQQSLIEARERGLNFGIVVIDNGGAKSTGGQKKLGDIYDVGNVPNVKINYEKATREQISKILSGMKNEGKLAILYIETQ